jgi:hypothetical protein
MASLASADFSLLDSSSVIVVLASSKIASRHQPLYPRWYQPLP